MRAGFTSVLKRIGPMALIAGALAAGPASAHVALDSPNGGEQLAVGSTVTIHWHVVIGHTQLDWDLYYSTTGPDGPWIAIALDLPVGNGSTGAAHTYDWTVPDDPSNQVRVRVVQDNSGFDYEDVSDGDLAIVSETLFVDGFESGNTTGWSGVVD